MPLRINHAATRERLSVVTTVCDDENAALQEKRLPIEVLFKGKTRKILAALSLPAGLNMSVAHAEKGSYREENVLNFLRRWLDEWTSVVNNGSFNLAFSLQNGRISNNDCYIFFLSGRRASAP